MAVRTNSGGSGGRAGSGGSGGRAGSGGSSDADFDPFGQPGSMRSRGSGPRTANDTPRSEASSFRGAYASSEDCDVSVADWFAPGCPSSSGPGSLPAEPGSRGSRHGSGAGVLLSYLDMAQWESADTPLGSPLAIGHLARGTSVRVSCGSFGN